MAFSAFPLLKMNKKKYAALILAVEFKSEEKSSLSPLEKKLAIFARLNFAENR